MAYLTAAEFRAGHTAEDLANLLADVAEADRDAVIDAAAAEGSELLDGYCSPRYVLPLASTAQVKHFTDHLLFEVLCHRRPWNLTEAIQSMLKENREQLQAIVTRKYNLVGQVEVGSASQATNVREAAPSSRVAGRQRIFTPDKTKGF